MRDGIIYAVMCKCHPEDGIRYIGQTVISINSRKHVHLWNARTPESKSYKSYFSNWIRKHGEENVEFFQADLTTEDKLDALEDFWIQRLRGDGAKLTNLKAGGGQARGHKRPPHARSMSGPNNPMYGKDRKELMKYARSFQGPPSEATKKLWSEQRTGEGNARSVLTDDVVLELRKQEKKYGLFSKWAREYGVSVQTIYLAYNRKTWTHVD